MTKTTSASDLPQGSIVATRSITYMRVLDGIGSVWHGTNGGRMADDQIDMVLGNGGVVVRVGYGEGA